MKKNIFNKLKHNFFARTFLGYMVVIAFAFGIILMVTLGAVREFFFDDLETHLTNVGKGLKFKIVDIYESGDYQTLDRMVKSYGADSGIRVTVIKPNGWVAADSMHSPEKMENHGSRPEVIRALQGEIGHETRFSKTMDEKLLYVALPVEKNETVSFVIRLSLSVNQINNLESNLKWKFSLAFLVLFALVLSLAWYFSRTISRPVHEIIHATRELAGGNFNIKIYLESKDELAQMTESFNKMVADQKSIFDRLNENQLELHAIISSIKEGLLVISKPDKIKLCNTSFEEMCRQQNITDKKYWEVFRISNFENFVSIAFETQNSFYEELTWNDKHYLVGFNPMKSGEKLVVIFRDISSFRQLERIKKDFVVNLTHELKTPLTAIKGFMEILEMEEEIKNTQYVEIIKRHTDRMNMIVSDMLTLSELEDKNREIYFENIDLGEIVINILKIYEHRITEKDIRLIVDISAGIPSIMGEKFKIEQMVMNLIDNAVKYTESGEISIGVDSLVEEHKILFQVRNTGSVIPQKSLNRIFERFYVVDKSRSRKLGGTGLGLSIVKHVVMLHNGEISVDSSENAGTVFTVILPISHPKIPV